MSMDEIVKQYSSFVVVVVVMGSLVDIFQFVWILKRTYRKFKRIMYNKIKKEVLRDFHDNQPTSNKNS